MSAAAPAIRVETSSYFQTPLTHPSVPAAKETIQELVHELRQPLSSIEAIAYYVEMTLPPELLQARQYMHRLQELVAQADTVLGCAVLVVRKPAASAATAAAAATAAGAS
jgi:nitrogen-specific signal transduction histidine kinase